MQQQHSTGLIVPILAAQMERGEAAPVLHVDVGLGPAQGAHCPTEPLPGSLVQRSVA